MDLLIFDLDGTLIDSRIDLAQAVNAMLEHLGRSPLPLEQVVGYVGNGAPVLIRRSMGEAAADADVASGLRYFLEYYAQHALDATTFYPGVKESIRRLRAAGKRLAVLTNKPEAISRAIIEGLGAGPGFFRIYGGDSFAVKKPDPHGIEELMRESGVARERTLMIGDSAVDVATARNARVMCCGVTYGLQPESLVNPAPELTVDRMETLADWVISRG